MNTPERSIPSFVIVGRRGDDRILRRRIRPSLLVETMRRVRVHGDWHAVVAYAGRADIWSGRLGRGETCLAAVDPHGRAVTWLGRSSGGHMTDARAAECSLRGSGVLWAPGAPDQGARRLGWTRIQRAHALALVTRTAGLSQALVDELVARHPAGVATSVDAWLAGHLDVALGALEALVVDALMAGDASSPGPGRPPDEQ